MCSEFQTAVLTHKRLKHNWLVCWKLSVYRLGFMGFNLAHGISEYD